MPKSDASTAMLTGKEAVYGSFDAAAAAAADLAPPRRATWPTAALLIIADVVGVGVMGVADAFAQLGWGFGVAFCVLMMPLNVYCGLLTWESMVDAYPSSLSLAHISWHAYGQTAYYCTAALVYSSIFLILGDYILCLGLCLEQLFYAHEHERAVWSLLAVLVLVPFCQLRTLNATMVLLYVNALSIVVAVGVSLGYLVFAVGQRDSLEATGGRLEAVASDLSWSSFAQALGKLAFAYTGVLMYPEIIVEMEDARLFPRALYASAPFQLAAFTSVGCVGYAYLGSGASGLLIQALPPGLASQVCAAALFVHLVITFLIKGTVLSRATHRLLAPSTLNDFGSWRGSLTWGAISLSLLLACYGVAVSIPFFDELTSLIGCLQMSLIGFCLPVLFAARARLEQSKPLSLASTVGFGAILVFGLALALVGTAGAVKDIVGRWGVGNAG